MRDLAPLLHPRSVAVIGASSSLDSLAGRPVKNLIASGVDIAVYPVNPKRDEIGGLRCYPDVAAVPEAPDVAVIMTPAAAVPAALRAAGERGTRAAIVITAGFGEMGLDGAAAQRELADIASEYGMALLGPNTVGVHDYRRGLPLSFVWFGRRPSSDAGSVAVVTQSGSGMAALADRLLDFDLPLGHGVATGNESDVSVTDLVEYFAEQDEVRVIAAVFEQIRDGQRFTAVCRRLLELGKPLVALKLGRTPSGNRAAASHTGSLAGEYPAIRAVMRQFGVVEVDDLEDFAPTISAALPGRFPAGRRFGAVSSSGAATVICADKADELRLSTPEFSERAQERIRPYLPSFSGGANNPLDLTAQAAEHPHAMTDVLEILADEEHLDALIAGTPSSTGPKGLDTADRIAALQARTDKPIFSFILTGEEARAARERQRSHGIPVLRSPGIAVDVVERLSRFGRARARPASVPSPVDGPLPTGTTEFETLRWLREHGIPTVPQELAASAADARAAADRLGYPVAVKISSPDIAHKTEAGGVALGLVDAAAVAAAFERVTASASAAAPGARIDGVTVSPMVSGAIELIAGVHRDPTFGPILAFGLGGVWAEALGDVSLRAAPIAFADVPEMLEELRGAALLDGARGIAPVDRAALAALLTRLSDLAWHHRGDVSGIDLNPIVVTTSGQLLVVDAALFA